MPLTAPTQAGGPDIWRLEISAGEVVFTDTALLQSSLTGDSSVPCVGVVGPYGSYWLAQFAIGLSSSIELAPPPNGVQQKDSGSDVCGGIFELP